MSANPKDGAVPGGGLSDALVPGLIHELRHPLTAMKAGLQLLSHSLGTSATSKEEWALIMTQVAQMEELLSSYDDFLRPERVVPGPFLLASVVDHAVDLLRHRVKHLGDGFTCKLPASPVTVTGTPRAVTHALTNLLLNALDAIDEAGGRKRLEVRLVQLPNADTVELRVSDEGTGIKPEVASRLFEERITTKAPGKGSGLGLSVAARMLAAFGGTVALVPAGEANRAAWAKTEFRITLRKHGGEVTTRPTPVPTPAPKLGGEPPVSVLVVDDEPAIANLLQSLLGRMGYKVTSTTSSTRAAELLAAGPFDLLVTDKNMPDLSGVDLSKMARKLQPTISVMLVTGFASKESASELRKLGIDDYVTKPFEIDDLRTRVKELLARRRAMQEASSRAPAPRGAARLAAVALEPGQLEKLNTVMVRMGGTAIAAMDVASALAMVPPIDLLVVSSHHLTREAKLAVWKTRMERPALAVVLLSDGGLEDEMVGISVGTRFLLGTSLELMEIETVLRAARGQ